ncbi:uncharacterized protein MELLADRAFT_108425 [Melampsora larici-populina 98AG31]|uniref:GRAM domain-containing protein n=1 Tax=Melampsora larici-populina (strain 98AG31 / pathotype 3-4-7) TaxID=747676 RepID=F4RT23_MELLP|nr:uncharacterized protein MELLADRAFT_108425 [Melampsora larici-populina 98AG31]EGG04431.1 hypothetical protein MELLADRAFT_108425 [Melampsora larici-populina 98AG31]
MRESDDSIQPAGVVQEQSRSHRSSCSNALPPSLPPRPRNKSIVQEDQTNLEAAPHARFDQEIANDMNENNAVINSLEQPTKIPLSENLDHHVDPELEFSAALSNHSEVSGTTLSDQTNTYDQLQSYNLIKEENDLRTLEELEDLEIDEFLKRASKQLKEVTIQTITQDETKPILIPKPSDFTITSTNEIDWLKYGESYLIYQLESFCPTSLFSTEVIPNASVGQLRVYLQRCYVLAPPEFWNSLLEGKIGDLYRWTHPTRSAKYCLLYIILWIFDLIPSFIIVYFLYLIIERQFKPPPISQLKQESNQRRLLNQEAEQLGTGLLLLKDNEGNHLSMLAKGIGGSTSVFAAPVIPGLSSNSSKDQPRNLEGPSKVKDHVGIYRLGRCLYSHYGIHVQLMLSDFAEIGEKIKNLYLWRNPSSCKQTCLKLLIILIYTITISQKWLIKNFLAWLGFEFFFVFRLIEKYPKFRKLLNPIYLIFYQIPNDTEYVLEILKNRSIKTSKLQEESNQVKGNQKKEVVDRDFERRSSIEDNQSNSSGSDRSKRWRKKAVESGVETYRRIRKTYQEYNDKSDRSSRNLNSNEGNQNHRTFAILNGKAPGTLAIKQDEIWFEPMKGFRTKVKSSIKPNEESLIDVNDQDLMKIGNEKSSLLNVLVFEAKKIVRIKKIRSFGFGMIGGDGIEIQIENQIVRFGNVSHRDETFHKLLLMSSLSNKLLSSHTS